MRVADMSAALAEVADHVAFGEIDVARRLAEQKLPFLPRKRMAKRLDERQMTEIMLRDGFIDRYTGLRVWYPGALRLLSEVMPDLVPGSRSRMSQGNRATSTPSDRPYGARRQHSGARLDGG